MTTLLQPTTIITGHTQADLDAQAAMVLAKKLYPDAVLIAPSLLPQLQPNEFTTNIPRLFNFTAVRQCDFSQLQTIVLVDAHQYSRFEHIKDLLSLENIEFHVYDHHPDTENDVPATVKHTVTYGSSTTLLTLMLKEQNIAFTTDEATVGLLGIHEDTGSFSFGSTTPEDHEAASYLHQFGPDLAVIKETTMATSLTREKVHLLDTLFKNAVTHNIQGIHVTISDIISPTYIENFSDVINSFMDMEKLPVVIVLAAMGERIYLIGRSNIPEIHMGNICKAFGGGGHDSAGSAVIKDHTIPAVREELVTLLVTSFTPHLPVKAHMTKPPLCLGRNQTLAEAETFMNRFGLKAAPVIREESQECIGILEQQTAAKAVAHEIGNLSVGEYMKRDIITLSPNSSLHLAVEILLSQQQRLIPITEGKTIIGVLTRTDIVKLLIDQTLHIPEATPYTKETFEKHVVNLIHEELPQEHIQLLQTLGELGDELDIPVYAVGGFVRDLMLRSPTLDIDISVEGSAIDFAKLLARKLKGNMKAYIKFNTATVYYRDEKNIIQHIDIASSRLEYYKQPAALPTVEFSSIKMDLYRRDFTINALAIQLNKKKFGTLIDPFGGQRDLKEKTIAVLHSLSFVEDPTRILRAIRFEQRFDFTIAPNTSRLIKNALTLNMFDKLSGKRFFNELDHMFNEENVTQCLERTDEWNILSAIHPVLKLTPTKTQLVNDVREIIAWYKLLYTNPTPQNWIIYLLCLSANGKYVEVSSMLSRLGFEEKTRIKFLELRENVRKVASSLTSLHKKNQLRASDLYTLLSPISIEGLLYMMTKHGKEHNIGRDISRYLTSLQDIQIDITGEDLVSLGAVPGPIFGEILRQIHVARLDNEVITRDEQLELAQICLQKLTKHDDKK